MQVIERKGIWKLLDTHVTIILTDDKQLDMLIEDPRQPFADDGENKLYEKGTTLYDICRRGQESGATFLQVSYDFFFGGNRRSHYPENDKLIKAYKVIHDVAQEHGLQFGASIVSPLDVGPGFAQNHPQDEWGMTCQFEEGEIDDQGSFSVDIPLQRTWVNNKGPVDLTLTEYKVYRFREQKVEGTDQWVVPPESIMEMSDCAQLTIDEQSEETDKAGYRTVQSKVEGQVEQLADPTDATYQHKVFVLILYAVPELDYFHPQTLAYMKGIIDKHHQQGIEYHHFYSDEMHIQFDWSFNHFGPNEIQTRYLTKHFIQEYCQKFGGNTEDFFKNLIYFARHQEREGAFSGSPHVWGTTEKDIHDTWLFRKRYFEMLQRQVVDLCVQTKRYAEELYAHPIMTRAHATWQESPTCDQYSPTQGFGQRQMVNAYDYSDQYVASSSIRENMSACYDYFRWGEFLTGMGTDHPEGGRLERGYYALALASSFGILNEYPYSYCGTWGGPKEVLQRLDQVSKTYGVINWGITIEHNLIQGMSHRVSDVLTFYPLELNYVDARFGSWMVQYGYTDYITEEKFLQFASAKQGKIHVKGREYGTVWIPFEVFISEETMDMLESFVQQGGKLLWTSPPPVASEEGKEEIVERWKNLFGLAEITHPAYGREDSGSTVSFVNELHQVAQMQVASGLLVDRIYPVNVEDHAAEVALWQGETVGSMTSYPNGGKACYLGFRPRDNQSLSEEDHSTLYQVLQQMGAYPSTTSAGRDHVEAKSRDKQSNYAYGRFMNGTVSIAPHYRLIEEKWPGGFFRNEQEDQRFLKENPLPANQIQLEDELVQGRKISYQGEGLVTYRVNEHHQLVGFGGQKTTGIIIDGHEYLFSQTEPLDLLYADITEWSTIACEQVIAIRLKGTTGTQVHLPLHEMVRTSLSTAKLDVFRCKTSIYEADDLFEEWSIENDHLSVTLHEQINQQWLLLAVNFKQENTKED